MGYKKQEYHRQRVATETKRTRKKTVMHVPIPEFLVFVGLLATCRAITQPLSFYNELSREIASSMEDEPEMLETDFLAYPMSKRGFGDKRSLTLREDDLRSLLRDGYFPLSKRGFGDKRGLGDKRSMVDLDYDGWRKPIFNLKRFYGDKRTEKRGFGDKRGFADKRGFGDK
ncbi:hypothetical protein CAPTEDRAFT_204894 [Capitella teleta]|uniref:Uncharacterized protein n=1 Tax=Capitella teleta TaxID=283909 RepID=R7U2A2_CAPTE|nr:hypothetical protein CAPTEDRAFT_204894 [Capitella teleta]|eukprot:ELU00450.1 hypothetical protein CAPTEDRAFT_204894 [Capitella teleta]